MFATLPPPDPDSDSSTSPICIIAVVAITTLEHRSFAAA
jgi:hypothetical protein